VSTTTMAPGTEEATEAEAKGGGKLKRILILVVVLAVVGGGVWFFFLKPKPKEAPKPGEVVALEPIQINLSAGHYLRVGIALQTTADVKEELDGSKALDATIEVFSGLPMEEVLAPKQREHLKKELEGKLEHLYEGEVMDVYFTEFVTQ
jgi:flagellar FliL protein